MKRSDPVSEMTLVVIVAFSVAWLVHTGNVWWMTALVYCIGWAVVTMTIRFAVRRYESQEMRRAREREAP